MLKNNLIVKFSAIFGSGKKSTKKLCALYGSNPLSFLPEVKEKKAEKITSLSSTRILGNELREKTKAQLDLLWQTRLRRGIRNKFGLPSRGQRTHTNAKTKKKFKA